MFRLLNYCRLHLCTPATGNLPIVPSLLQTYRSLQEPWPQVGRLRQLQFLGLVARVAPGIRFGSYLCARVDEAVLLRLLCLNLRRDGCLLVGLLYARDEAGVAAR